MSQAPSPRANDLFAQRAALSEIWRHLSADSQRGPHDERERFRLPPIDKWLEKHFRDHRKYGSRDRREIRDNVFRVFRLLATQPELEGPKTPIQILERALQKDWQDLTLSLLPAPEHQLTEETPASELCRQYGIPSFYGEALCKRQNRSNWTHQETLAFCKRQSEEAPIWIRLNTLKGSLNRCIDRLTDEGIIILERDNLACRVKSEASLYKTRAFVDGLFEIQDYASQSIGREVPIVKGDFIWDVCAGAGGKSLQLGIRIEGTGSILCTDIRDHALEECRRRSKRSGLHNLHFQKHDALHEFKAPSAVRKRGGFDVVFVDAPCTSSGTWRRNPEARFRMDQTILEEFAKVQSGILEKASLWLRNEGTLAYATCSWLPEENEERVEAFLQSESGAPFQLVSMNLLSHPAGKSDTMFCAVLKKKAGS